ncbi:hypothetical protein [Pontibacter mangrovi]|uniref:Uncharacterized protein n=1 Tax=Pontibacter mangrovi TaxID=2589816 RepID=A0A501W0V8_9BACT|nr:hypothetical protein [Pontibacter mangrovi]TPE43613.1 hypothetical protein FJM65_12720 [Pontibacter mangrovi]
MEETIKIQEEFESLIEQLERLRSINDITSSNAESAIKVISEVDTFVQSTKDYKESVEADLRAKSEKIDELLSELEKSVQKMDSEAHKLSSSINQSFNDFKTATSDEFHTDISELRNVFQDSIDRIGSLKTELNNALMSHRTLTLEAIETGRTETSNKLNKVKSEVNNGLMSHRALFLEAIDKSKTETLNEIRYVKHQVSNTSNQLSNTIQTLNKNLLEEQALLRKGVEINRYILIFNAVALSIILAFLFL